MDGWLKLYRSILDSAVFQDAEILKVWIWLLCNVAFEQHNTICYGKVITLKPGQKTLGEIADYLFANGVIFPKHAHWTINGKWAECSNCHEGEKIAVLVHKDYCPACGAIMDEESVVIHP